jgi:hypothetical protein
VVAISTYKYVHSVSEYFVDQYLCVWAGLERVVARIWRRKKCNRHQAADQHINIDPQSIQIQSARIYMCWLLPHIESHHVKKFYNYVASCIKEAHYSPTLPLSENLTFDSSSAKSTVDTVLKVESGSDCHHYSVTGSNPRYLTYHPPDLRISTSPDSYPQPPW